ncbi:bifunctional helix-turn-helix transcriptional regulator/GNAT family N-acetyltransferase [Microvirga arsenatis]|uniref:GNAT family N-acetyltransferase n=1 Tax=Microvirga arsenatis TaxID=2692265 RepID=A0ABW9YXS9_9HYPH|nr:helix-turn-helix domain-containing GNAT family N-acetyltransferase [Microvirga arsenatis]NBJ10218.1 GNAT family N-acetyltransferase [Microvirga arsenatis]NBJ24883.1 GNAT family N-acetyltransferase [Microvirga arsenatis]
MNERQIQQVRRFNRIVTQHVGALEESYLQRGRPLGQARLLHEFGPDGVEVRALRERLKLDSGYVSRLLRSLQAQGLVTTLSRTGDGRVRHVVLTAKGRAERETYDALSDELAASFLVPLEPAQRERLVNAMAEVERLLRAGGVELRLERPDSAAARACLNQYFQELAERFESGFNPARSNPAGDEDMTPPAGFFIVAWLDGQPVGCGALKRGDGATGEIKRMWTSPTARGLGIARKVLRALEEKARESGLARLRLETNRSLTEAQALYRQEGYREVAPFNREPYAHHWFEKQL